MKRILIIITAIICLVGCSKKDDTNSVSYGLLQALQDENPSINISYLYEGVVEFMPAEPKVGIAFYPGGNVEYIAYAPLMAELAKQGYLCLLIRMPADLAMLNQNVGVKLRNQYEEIPHFYLAGHSLGGVTASMTLASNLEEFDGLILLAAYSTKDLSECGKTVISIYGSEDGVLNRDTYNQNKKYLPADLHEYIIEGGNHSGFGYYGHQDGDNEATISGAEQREKAVEYIAKYAK